MRIAAMIFLLFIACATCADKQVRLTSLQWPPYSGQQLTEQGASIAVAKAAFAAMGYTLTVDFFPWSRAVAQARQNATYAGYFPEYYSDEVAQYFIYSDPIGSGPLGFVERSDQPIDWQTLDDLKGKRIGVVQDYVNTEAFDQRVQSGDLTTEAVMSDRSNLLKLVNGRIDLAVIDPNVMEYLLNSDPIFADKSDKARINKQLLAYKNLFICFKKTAEGQHIADIFNQGLKKIDIDAIMAKHL
ncbi:substrate-binding periplasmic protein [Bacterioplanoides sp.]|uniref:substrate-binding periplasmic protein n=1 Tax=Bacterioplanoides sp. TaxID=2066072 RepID=UPI003AFFAD86